MTQGDVVTLSTDPAFDGDGKREERREKREERRAETQSSGSLLCPPPGPARKTKRRSRPKRSGEGREALEIEVPFPARNGRVPSRSTARCSRWMAEMYHG